MSCFQSSHGKTTKANFKNSAEGDGVPEVNDSPSHQVTARECPAQCSCARGLHRRARQSTG